MTTANAMVEGARACLGARFRPQGRDPKIGLDCLGLVLAALAAAGWFPTAPQDYALNGTDLAVRAEEGLANCGLAQAAGPKHSGDIVLFEPVAGQAHLAILNGSQIIHAHAGVGRVVECAPDPTWVVRSTWRLEE